MVRLPPQLYMNDKPLSLQDKKNILTHPVLGYNILREFSFPLPVCLAALEHHERVNGAGYPRTLQGEKISPYAKIIAVACSYDAVTSSRPYKEAKDHYSGMLDILRNTGKGYEDGVIRALVYSLSLFPSEPRAPFRRKPALVVDGASQIRASRWSASSDRAP
jgi:HD-GYP domain-containing protein (c-di-GMP phosphodiesterase class II)